MQITLTKHAEEMLVEREIEMKTLYDPEADALYVRFATAKVVESEEVSPGVIIDFDGEGKIVGVEVLNARNHLAAGTTFPVAAE